MNVRDRFKELRQKLADGTSRRSQFRRQLPKTQQQLEFSLPLIQRSRRALRLSPSATR